MVELCVVPCRRCIQDDNLWVTYWKISHVVRSGAEAYTSGKMSSINTASSDEVPSLATFLSEDFISLNSSYPIDDVGRDSLIIGQQQSSLIQRLSRALTEASSQSRQGKLLGLGAKVIARIAGAVIRTYRGTGADVSAVQGQVEFMMDVLGWSRTAQEIVASGDLPQIASMFQALEALGRRTEHCWCTEAQGRILQVIPARCGVAVARSDS